MTQAGQPRPATVNQAQRDYWTGEGPRQYAVHGARWETMMAPYGSALLDATRPRPGERVLDVGCGFGTTSIGAAQRVAPGGSVVGVHRGVL